MVTPIRKKFSTKLILLISLVFIIPVATSLVTLVATSNSTLKQLDEVIASSGEKRVELLKQIFPKNHFENLNNVEHGLKLLREYEYRRTFGLFMSLLVISLALAGVVILLSMLILKRAMVSLHDLSLAALKVGEGEFDVDLKARSHDEFANLTQAFKLMADKLKDTMVSRDFYDHVLHSLPAAVFTVDEGGVVTTWNKHAEVLTGLSSCEVMGKDVAEFTGVIGSLPSNREIPSFGVEATINPKDGNRKIVSKGADRLYDKHGNMTGYIETFFDITEQKEMEKQLVQAKEKAEESSRLRSEFLANMSHEIRTPLNGILGLAELLQEDEKDTERKANLGTIRQCGQNLLHLINEILELSKLEAGRMILHPVPVSLKDMVWEAVSTIEVGCKRKGIELKIDVSDKVPETMEVDNHKLVQILINLLGNAHKFTDKGFIHLKVSPYRGGKLGDIVFAVSDSGVGIPPDRQQYIFESFTQAEGYLNRSGEGTGLGLTIARKLVNLMGGEIWLESEVGSGSTFYFTINTSA